MLERVVASFVVRVIHEPDNEQIPWNIVVQHIQNGRAYRLTDLEALGHLCKDITEAETQLKNTKLISLGTDKLWRKGSEKYE